MGRYNPSPTNKEILDAAFDHIKSVPYKVSLRWVFYRLHQDGYYPEKDDYLKWKSLASVARKRFYKDWRPNTLMDDTREIIGQNYGYYDEYHARDQYFEHLVSSISVDLDHFTEQPEVLLICFEARGMANQFRYYTDRIDLVPFGGDPSIHLKWRIAKKIERWSDRYEKPIRILYFGDYDPKGMQIADSAIKDIRDWCEVEFKLTRCGLTLEQAQVYNIPENPAKPGEYQWEALTDSGAAEIIEGCVYSYIDKDIIEQVEKDSIPLTNEFKNIAKTKLLD